MRTCHVCSGHTVDDDRVFHRACVTLAAAGYDVHLLATGRGTQADRERGVTVHPLPVARSRYKRLFRRSSVARMALDLKPDLLHVHEPELLGATLAVAGSRPVIYDVHESFLDVLQARDWIPCRLRPLARAAWDRWERRLVRQCAGIVVVTERIAERYRPMHRNVQVVANYPDLSEFQNLPPVLRDSRTCVFAGLLQPDRGLSEVLAAVAILKDRGLRIPLALAGPPSSDAYLRGLLAEARARGIGELVEYHGVLSKREAIRFQHKASIGLVPYLPVPNSMASMANKLLECMALGLPVVYSDFPNYREIAGANCAGIAVDPTSPVQIADAIECLVKNPRLARQLGESGRRATGERFNWSIEQTKLLDLYREILDSRDRS